MPKLAGSPRPGTWALCSSLAQTQYAAVLSLDLCGLRSTRPLYRSVQIHSDMDHSGKDCLVNVYLATMVFGAEPA